MPGQVGEWVSTSQGVRKLQVNELANGLGVPGEWNPKKAPLPLSAVENATSIHVWTVVGDAISDWMRKDPNQGDSSHPHKADKGTRQLAPPPRTSLPPNPLFTPSRGRTAHRSKTKTRETSPTGITEAGATWD